MEPSNNSATVNDEQQPPAGANGESGEQKPLQSLDVAGATARVDAAHLGEIRRTKQMLDKCKKHFITLFQAEPGQPQLSDEVVTINDYSYQIKRGEEVEVPEPVACVLIQAGKLRPYGSLKPFASMFPTVAAEVAKRRQG